MVKETYLTRILKMDAPKIMGKLKKKEVLTIYTTPHSTDTRTYTHTHTHTHTQHSHERNKRSTYC